MPLIVNDFTWNQTERTVTIKVPLRGVHQSKVDIFTSSKYIKASYEKYFFEVFLRQSVWSDDSKCILTPDHILFELIKTEQGLWDELEMNLTKREKQDLKKQLILEEHQKIQNKLKELAIKKSELKRTAVREQICLDTKQRQLIDEIKASEKQNALGDVDTWKNNLSITKTSKFSSQPKKSTKFIPVPTPLPRNTATIEVDFTRRQFPTPSRESKLEEEEEWLRKQAAARRSVGFVSEDLRPEEKNPQYLKEKGDEFMKASNYLGAISAYSFGIKLRDTFPDLYVGRAAAHLAVGTTIIFRKS